MTPEQTYELKEKVASLESMLLAAHPEMPLLLRKIHTQLQGDPELVTLLSEEEIGLIVRGLSTQMKVEINAVPTKKESANAMLNRLMKKGGAGGMGGLL